ncbi:hypothetical protein CCACVL1_07153 [Corchorus capsularis]|uniref:Uncharacterized protein n=1 Tax=Corchorus capsularis TaxID=210143 RepID=A0A1R3J960_COCAP|nr:hypothetical protein CCACVL1_07153 [Corchorus capsularis]
MEYYLAIYHVSEDKYKFLCSKIQSEQQPAGWPPRRTPPPVLKSRIYID